MKSATLVSIFSPPVNKTISASAASVNSHLWAEWRCCLRSFLGWRFFSSLLAYNMFCGQTPWAKHHLQTYSVLASRSCLFGAIPKKVITASNEESQKFVRWGVGCSFFKRITPSRCSPHLSKRRGQMLKRWPAEDKYSLFSCLSVSLNCFQGELRWNAREGNDLAMWTDYSSTRDNSLIVLASLCLRFLKGWNSKRTHLDRLFFPNISLPTISLYLLTAIWGVHPEQYNTPPLPPSPRPLFFTGTDRQIKCPHWSPRDDTLHFLSDLLLPPSIITKTTAVSNR